MVGSDASEAILFQLLEGLKEEVAPSLDKVESRINKVIEINKLIDRCQPISDKLEIQMHGSKVSRPLENAVCELLRNPLSEWGFSVTAKDHFALSRTLTWTPQYSDGAVTYFREGSLDIDRILNEKIAALPDSSLKMQLIDGFSNMIDLASISLDAEEGKIAILAQKYTESIAVLKAKAKVDLANAADDYSRERIWDAFGDCIPHRYPQSVKAHCRFYILICFGRLGLPKFYTNASVWMEYSENFNPPQELLQLE